MGAPMVLTAAMIASATSGTLISGDPYQRVEGFSIDSRTLSPGDLFFPIVAARDGHHFIDDALERGACGVVVGSGYSGVAPGVWEHGGASGDHPGQTHHGAAGAAREPQRPVVIQVANTTTALQDLARFVRRASGAKVVAITGSAGKTTTKEAIALFLSRKYRVIKNTGNLNNHLGLPLSLLELRHGADLAVMELGMNHAGEIRVLVGIAEPELRVWINVGDAHLGYFESRDAIADAKAEILERARAGDLLVCNADDPFVMSRVADFPGRRITFGLTPNADVRAEHVTDLGLDGTRATIRTERDSVDVHVPLLGRGNLRNVLAAAAVATALDIGLSDVAVACADLAPAPHRGAVLRLASGITVIDDSYNSSPAALTQALEVIARETRARRKAAVLGEMLELGEHARKLHEACGERAARAGLDRLIAVGGDAAAAFASAARRAGMPDDAVTVAASSSAAAELIASWLAPGDLVLVKGSRGIRTDTVVDRITAEFS